MGALPKRKISKQRKKQRRAHHALEAPALSNCPECNKPKLSHKVCGNCGVYNGVQVLITD